MTRIESDAPHLPPPYPQEDVPPILQEANFAFDKGEYGRAGELFEHIAQAADARGGPRAPIFHLQAGRARVLAGQVELGLPSLQRGLELLARRGQLKQFHRAANRTVTEFKNRGLASEAAEIEEWTRKLTPPLPFFEEEPPASRPMLLARCPSCGAMVRPDEVEWLDETTAECAYCGRPVR